MTGERGKLMLGEKKRISEEMKQGGGDDEGRRKMKQIEIQ